jgi:thiamine-phosphate pyrophosphorylase
MLNLGKIYAITPDKPLDLELITTQILKYKIKILQYRRKLNDDNLKLLEAKKLQQLCIQLGVILIINDDVELCKQVDANGVHLGKNDIDIANAREVLGNNKIIGVSCYNDLDLAQKYQKLGVDYLAFGAVFPSTTKPNSTQCPLETITLAKQECSLPIIAIGGINFENKDKVLNSGADMVAMIHSLW